MVTPQTGLTRRQRDRLATLKRRRKTLVRRLARYDARAAGYDVEGDPDRAKAELSALTWAIHVIETAPTDVLKEAEQ